MIHDGTKTNAEKDHDHENHKRKEIRRDSKTGFEKFEDYFDSDSDNTTLKGNNVTTVNDSTEDKGSSNGTAPMTGDNSVEAIAQGREQSIEKKSGSEKESSSEHPSKAEAVEKTLKTVQPSEE